jgi:ABC-type molybdate transport system substrate-binding protein
MRPVGIAASIQPRILYKAAVVKGTQHAAQARAFVTGLVNGVGERALRSAGFLPPP